MIKSVHRNVVTVEDPVEYQVELVNQVQIDEARSRTFASSLRSILRQDPDIIMIGEIRDAETAQIAVQAARNYRRLREKGVTVRKTIDCLIATFCMERGHRLLHNDRDFDGFEEHLGLQVVS